MKLSIVFLSLLVVLAVLLAVSEAKKAKKPRGPCRVDDCKKCNRSGKKCKKCNAGFKLEKPKKKRCLAIACNVDNCQQCNLSGNKCLECATGFELKSNGAICRAPSACRVAKCLKCNLAGKRCKRCEAGTTRSYNRKKCLSPDEPDPDCPTKDCDDYLIDENTNTIDDDDEDIVIVPNNPCRVAKCVKCNRSGKRCRRCEAGTKRSYNRKKCLSPDEPDPDCPTKDCDDYVIDDNDNGIDDDDEDAFIVPRPRPANPCQVAKCLVCNLAGRRCKRCEAGTIRSKNRKKCLSPSEPDPDCPAKNCEDTLIDVNENGIDDDDENIIIADPCDPNPCGNGGTCSGGDCTCASGFEGDNCQTVADPCDPNPCANGGTCSGGDCTCASGYEGATCKTGCSYTSIGCWGDTYNRAIATLEGADSRLTGAYWARANAIELCFQAAKERGYPAFAVQNGGWCASSATAMSTYQKYGARSNCANGKGGGWANDVYELTCSEEEADDEADDDEAAVPPPGCQYESIGCWGDTGNRAIATLEGADSRLTGAYWARANSIELCYQAAKERGYPAFAVQNGGWCAASATAMSTYQKYGARSNCASGKGGGWANDVYQITC